MVNFALLYRGSSAQGKCVVVQLKGCDRLMATLQHVKI
jgi:hypothetical protein